MIFARCSDTKISNSERVKLNTNKNGRNIVQESISQRCNKNPQTLTEVLCRVLTDPAEGHAAAWTLPTHLPCLICTVSILGVHLVTTSTYYWLQISRTQHSETQDAWSHCPQWQRPPKSNWFSRLESQMSHHTDYRAMTVLILRWFCQFC